MGTAGYGNHTEDKPPADPKRPDPNIKNLPSDATQPGTPKGTEKPDDQKAGAPEPTGRMPPAGPHAEPELMNPDATPGTGLLTSTDQDDDADASSG